MNTGTADVVWRGLSAAAITRYTRQVTVSENDTTDAGYDMQVQTGTRVLMLAWSPQAKRAAPTTDLRNAIAVALQGDRTLDSLVPGGIPNHISAFPLGGGTKPDVTWSNRIQLTLGYDPTMPDGRDLATQIRTRLEDTGGMSVRLRAVDPTAADSDPPDLMVLDRKAWTSTGLAWLQPYLRVAAAGQRRRRRPSSSASTAPPGSARKPRWPPARWPASSARRPPTSCCCR